MQYILSYRSRFRPLSSLCSLCGRGWGGGGGGGAGGGRGSAAPCQAGPPPPPPQRPPSPAVLVKPVQVCGIFVLVAFAKTKNGFVESPFSRCFLFVLVTSFLFLFFFFSLLLLFAVV